MSGDKQSDFQMCITCSQRKFPTPHSVNSQHRSYDAISVVWAWR